MSIVARGHRPRLRSASSDRRTRTRGGFVAVAAVVLVAGGTAGCSDSGSDDSGPTTTMAPTSSEAPAGEETDGAGAALTVDVAGFRFDPDPVVVPAGSTVTFANADTVAHTVTADDGTFDLELPADGGDASEVFSEAGTVTYFCSIHPSMTGSVVVEP